MNIKLEELIEGIGYSSVEVTIETPIARFNFIMEIDHISKSDNGYYLEGEDGQFFEIYEDAIIVLDDNSYYVSMNDCYIRINPDA